MDKEDKANITYKIVCFGFNNKNKGVSIIRIYYKKTTKT